MSKRATNQQISYGLRFQRLFRLWKQRNDALRKGSLLNTLLLIEIDAHSGIQAKEFPTWFGVDQSRISRSLAELEAEGLISSVRSKTDARARNLNLSSHGNSYIRAVDKRANKRLEELSQIFTKAEFELFCHYSTQLADGFEHPPAQPRKSEHPLRPIQRRLVRCFGMLGRSFLNSNVAVSELQVLSYIVEKDKLAKAKDIAEVTGLHPNRISQIVNKNEKAGFIKRQRLESDKRAFGLLLSEAGKDFLAKHEQEAAKTLTSAMTEFTISEMEQFLHLLERFVSLSRIQILPNTWLSKIETAEVAHTCRTFMLEQLVARKWHHAAPTEFLLETHYSLAALQSGNPEAVFQFEVVDTHASLTCAVWSARLDTENERQKLITAMFTILTNELHTKTLHIKFQPFDQLLNAALKRQAAAHGIKLL